MRTLAQQVRRLKRRDAGVYAYRTDRHLKSGREWGYVGESLWLAEREKDHAGQGRWTHPGRPCPNAPRDCGHGPKPWMDLRPRRYVLVRLPWWLAFSQVTRAIETLAILVLLPRYNWSKSPRRDRVGPRGQAAQRQLRDDLGWAGVVRRRRRSRLVSTSLQVAGVLLVVVGVLGWVVTR